MRDRERERKKRAVTNTTNLLIFLKTTMNGFSLYFFFSCHDDDCWMYVYTAKNWIQTRWINVTWLKNQNFIFLLIKNYLFLKNLLIFLLSLPSHASRVYRLWGFTMCFISAKNTPIHSQKKLLFLLIIKIDVFLKKNIIVDKNKMTLTKVKWHEERHTSQTCYSL